MTRDEKFELAMELINKAKRDLIEIDKDLAALENIKSINKNKKILH